MNWVDDYLNHDDARREREKEQANLQRQVSSTAGESFRTLSKLVGDAVQTFVRRRSASGLKFHSGPDTFTVHREGDLPYIDLTAKFVGGDSIAVRTQVKKTADDELADNDWTLKIVAKGPNKILYHIGTSEHNNLEDVVSELLIPLFNLIVRL